MMQTKKAAISLYIILIGVIASCGVIIYNVATHEPSVEYAGETATKIISGIDEQQKGFQYLDQAARQAAYTNAKKIVRNNGYTSEAERDENCETLVHPVLSEDCEWNEEALQEEVSTAMQQYANNYEDLATANLRFDTTQQARNGHAVLTISTPRNIQYRIQDERRSTSGGSEQQEVTAFGDTLVDLSNIPNIQCEESRTCTGHTRQCDVTPDTYNALLSLSEYLEEHNIRGVVTQATRSWAMQNAFWQEYQSCQAFMEDCTASTQSCADTYAQRARQQQLCSPTCVPACNPGPNPDQPNEGCTHITGRAVDIVFVATNQNGEAVNLEDRPQVHRNIQKTMCDFGFINFAGEIWHYEYKTPNWEESQDTDNPCTYSDENPPNWAAVDPLHEAINQRLT